MVARLKQQVQDLKEELAMATGEQRDDELTPEEQEKLGLPSLLYMYMSNFDSGDDVVVSDVRN